ncbi:MAG: sulfatase [Planctomycetaceae bacterium]
MTCCVRRFFAGFLACVVIVSSPFVGYAADKPVKAPRSPRYNPPNIIFVLTDDQRFDTLGCAGNQIIKTPHIDALAKNGVRFTNMFCTTSICAVSRANFITGQYARRHGIHGFRKGLTPEQFADTFPAVLRSKGYRTGVIGKWGIGGKPPRDHYDLFAGFPGQGRYFPKGKSGQPGTHLTHKLGDQAVSFLESCPKNKPFLLQLYTKAAHCQDGDPWPFQPDPRYNSLYTDVKIPTAKTATEKHFRQLPKFLQTSEARRRWFVRFANRELYQKSVKDYYRLITGIDDVIGRLRKKLEEKGVANNTVIIFTSDNGFYLGEHGLAGKWYMHEESIRLPLVIYDPRMPEKLRGRTLDELVLSIDIAPTIMQLARTKIPTSVQGKSLVPLLANRKTNWREDFLYEHLFKHRSIPQTEGVRTKRWKYTRYISVEPVYEELFDLKTDPHEETNLAGDAKHAAKLAELRKRCDQLIKQAQ